MDTDPGHQLDHQLDHQHGHEVGRRLDHQFGLAGYSASTYGDSFADVYDDWYGALGDDDFVASIVRDLPATPVRVLELGVGTGRLIAQFLAARPAARSNVETDAPSDVHDDIMGVDSSAAMIARAAARHFPSNVTLATCDFTQSLPDGPFDVIFVGYNTLFNVADADALQSCLALVASRLAPQGRFVIDVVHPTNDDDADHVSVRHMTTTEVVLSVSSHDPDGQRITGQFIQFTNGATVQLRPWSVRYFSPSQLDAIATSAGLRLVSRHSDGTGAEFTESSRRHISRYAKQ